jgi:hypothetical protein
MPELLVLLDELPDISRILIMGVDLDDLNELAPGTPQATLVGGDSWTFPVATGGSIRNSFLLSGHVHKPYRWARADSTTNRN